MGIRKEPVCVFIVACVALLFIAPSAAFSKTLETFIMDYPHGEDRIMVTSEGNTYLFYGAAPNTKNIKTGIFSAENLYTTFKQYLYENLPRDQWPNPESTAGMVTLRYQDGSSEDYLIFDLEELTSAVFLKAKKNIILQSKPFVGE